MSRLSKSFRKVSSKVINKFGGTVTFKRISSGVYNASSGTVSETITTATIKGIVENVNQREINDLIHDNDKLLTIAASDLSFTPTTTDRVEKDGVNFQIIRINTDENDNQNIKYQIYLRQ